MHDLIVENRSSVGLFLRGFIPLLDRYFYQSNESSFLYLLFIIIVFVIVDVFILTFIVAFLV